MRDPHEVRDLARECRERAKLRLSRMLLTNYACGRSSWPMKLTISSAVLKADQRR